MRLEWEDQVVGEMGLREGMYRETATIKERLSGAMGT